jgi:hypothetical protein
MARWAELSLGLLATTVGLLVIGVFLFAPISSTDPATDAYRHYSLIDAGLSPFQVVLFAVLTLLYVGVLVGAVLHGLRASGLGRKLLRVSGFLLVPATVATGEGGVYITGLGRSPGPRSSSSKFRRKR